MKEYVILTDAREVAGAKNPGKKKRITLTDEQAEHPLRRGHIELATEEAPAPKKSGSK
jgi:hypothetical protein